MRSTTAVVWLSALCCMSTAQAGENASTRLCRMVAHELWTEVATEPLHEQTPLTQLPGIARGPDGLAMADLVEAGIDKAGQSISDALIGDHAAAPDLAQQLRDTQPATAARFGDSDVWLLDRVDGTLGCHTPIIVSVAAGGAVHEVELADKPDPTALCALSALSPVSIGGIPALWIEQSGGFSNSLAQSTVSIAALQGEAFAPPCTVTIDYAITDRATHAFCDGVDCVPLVHMAEVLALRLRLEETDDSLGAEAIRDEKEEAAYRRMMEIAAEDKQHAVLPTFGVTLDSPYGTFADQILFPVRLDDGGVYLARMGHGGFGWRQTADTLLALYRLRDNQLVPAASVYVSARRSGITGISVQ